MADESAATDTAIIPTFNRNLAATIENANSLVSLYNSIRSDIKDYRDWKTKVNALLFDLGDWAPWILREQGEGHICMLPVLHNEQFNDHLETHEAFLKPVGTCKAKVGWAKLLFALGIGPDSEAIHWLEQKTMFDPIAQDAIRLKVDGAVLCHIVNLYRIYTPYSNNVQSPITKPEYFQLSFGSIRIRPSGDASDSFHAEFEEKSREHLLKKKVPFSYEPRPESGIKQGVRIEVPYSAYKVALDLGIFPAKASLKGADDNTTRNARAEKLIFSMSIVKESKDELFLATDQWAEDATRIYRRVAANATSPESTGNTTLAEYLAYRASISSSEEVRKLISRSFPDEDEDEDLNEELVTTMASVCMIEPRKRFRLYWTEGRNLSTTDEERARRRLKRVLFSDLSGWEKFWEGQWSDDLVEMAQNGNLGRLLQLSHSLADKPILIMAFHRDGHDLWKARKCYID